MILQIKATTNFRFNIKAQTEPACELRAEIERAAGRAASWIHGPPIIKHTRACTHEFTHRSDAANTVEDSDTGKAVEEKPATSAPRRPATVAGDAFLPCVGCKDAPRVQDPLKVL